MTNHIHPKYAKDTDPYGYYIIVLADYSQSELDQLDSVSHNLVRNARYNTDNTKCVMIYRGDTPAILSSYTTYSKSELEVILQASEWISPEPEDEE